MIRKQINIFMIILLMYGTSSHAFSLPNYEIKAKIVSALKSEIACMIYANTGVFCAQVLLMPVLTKINKSIYGKNVKEKIEEQDLKERMVQLQMLQGKIHSKEITDIKELFLDYKKRIERQIEEAKKATVEPTEKERILKQLTDRLAKTQQNTEEAVNRLMEQRIAASAHAA